MLNRLRTWPLLLMLIGMGITLTTPNSGIVTAQSSLPTGVTLRNIDGGPTYFADNGFTYATQSRTINGVTYESGWDDPDFFPIGLWLPPMTSTADANRWKDLNLTAFFLITANSSLSLLRSNGFSGVIQADELSRIATSNGGALGSETIGIMSDDEPVTEADATGAIGSVSCTHQNNRFWFTQFLWTWIGYGDVGGVSAPTLLSRNYTTPCGTQRHINIQSADAYWVTGDSNIGGPFNPRQMYGLSSQLTSDQMERGMNYGQMIDKIRPYQTGSGRFPAPIWQFCENGGPYTENTSAASYISPPQLNACAWSNIIHGARGLMYFNHSFAGPASSSDNLSNSYYQTIQSGQTISIYQQTKATNGLILSLARVINSPFADGYVSVSPAPSGVTDFSGFDVMAKRTSTGDFYIFAMPRWSKTISNQTATFTIKNTGATQVTVLNENRTIPVTNGTQFVDTFATAYTVHIYRVTAGTTPPTPAAPTNLRILK
jgi:hypothetical protein